MLETNSKRIIVVGGGLVGSLSSCILAKRGYKVDLFESREDIRKTKIPQGRSINLALSKRGRDALKLIDLEDTVLNSAIPMKGRMLHDLSGNKKSVLYDSYKNQCIYSVGRNYLNGVLLDAAENFPNVRLNFNHKLIRANLEEGTVTFQRTTTNDEISHTADLIIGADGAFSTLRRFMLQTPLFEFHQTYIPHGYLELRVLRANSCALAPNHLHIWPRNEFMMIALPNADQSWTLTLFMPFQKFDALKSSEELLEFFRKMFPDAVEIIGEGALVEDFFKVKPSHLVSVKCGQCRVGKGLLVGDAAHAMVPFYGQGMNAGFEDCILLDELLGEGGLEVVLGKFTEVRKEDAHTICDLAMYNYVEMRDLVTTRSFYARKMVDELLFWLMPKVWVPLYNSVSFSRIGYKECLENRRWQNRMLMRAVCALVCLLVVTFALFVV